MAAYYWVGGSGTWNASTTTNWATSSGGSGGAGVPTAADTATFDSLSNATLYTVTVATGATCLDLSVAGPLTGNVTFSGSGTSAIKGSFTLAATGITWSVSGTVTFSATATGNTLTTNGISLATTPLTFSGVGGGWTLGSALTSGAIIVTAGTFNSGNFTITGTTFSTTGSTTRTVTLGTSTVNLSSASAWTSTGTNLSLSVGAATVNCSNASVTYAGGAFGQGTVNFTDTSSATHAITGLNSFIAISITPPTATGIRIVTFAANQTITTLSASGGSAVRRVQLSSSTTATSRTLTVGTLTSLSDIDFIDITGAGAASWASGTRLGNCAGNSGITFPAAKTVYWNLAGTQDFAATGWATSSGGTPAVNNFPLVQDTAVFDNAGAITTVNSAIAWNFGSVDMSARTSAITFNVNAAMSMYGNWANGSGTTISGSSTITFKNRSAKTITSAGKSFASTITIDAITSTLTLTDALVTSGNVTLTSGTFSTAGFSVQSFQFGTTGSATRALTLGNTTWTITQGSIASWNVVTSGFTLNAGTSTISFNASGAKTFTGGTGLTYYNINQAGAGALTINSASMTFNDIQNSYSATGATTITFQVSLTTASFTATGAIGKVLTLNSSTAGTARTLTKTGGGIVSVDYMSIQDSTAAGVGAFWYAGANSTSVSNNTGWIFTAPSNSSTSNFFLLFS